MTEEHKLLEETSRLGPGAYEPRYSCVSLRVNARDVIGDLIVLMTQSLKL
jgi:hypothetical protein